MAFWIKDNKQASSVWINSNKIIKYLFWVAFVSRGIIRMIDNAHYRDNTWFYVLTYVALGLGLLNLILNFIHWLKPKWFENKSSIEFQISNGANATEV